MTNSTDDTVTVDGVQIHVDKLESLGFVRKEEQWPKEGDKYWFVDSMGSVIGHIWDPYLKIHSKQTAFHNVYRTREQAMKAAKMMRRANAIIRACLEVDPDYEPDWASVDAKYTVRFMHHAGIWEIAYEYTDFAPAYVSSADKAVKVCELLTEWGIR